MLYACLGMPGVWKDRAISQRPFTEPERERFHNLLKLAAESPFEGERDNALAAAGRLAGKCGMSLEDAALSAGRSQQEPEPPTFSRPPDFGIRLDPRMASAAHLMDQHLHVDKKRREAALRAAKSRGLDSRAPTAARKTRAPRVSRARMNPFLHAAKLLGETSLPFQEVARITGLDIYQVVGMKLKMRKPERRGRGAAGGSARHRARHR